MSLVEHAKEELDRMRLGVDDPTGEDMDYLMREHILHMVKEFSDEGHSGFSASYAIAMLSRLLDFKPLTPLTGEDSEWTEVYSDSNGDPVYQNRRYGSVFKSATRGAYNIDGIVFWEWFTDAETGETSKIYFTSSDSAVPVEFPYDVPDKPEYQFRETEKDEE